MKTNDIILPVAAFALGVFIAKKGEGAAVGSYKTFDIYKPITTRRQAFAFFRYLVYVEGLNFHIDDSFENMVNYKTGKRTFTDAKAKVLNSRMDEVFEMLGEESYDIAMKIFGGYDKENSASIGKVTIVKKWWGSSNDDSKATYKEFKTKKEAQKYIDLERRFNAMQGNQFSGASNFYEIV